MAVGFGAPVYGANLTGGVQSGAPIPIAPKQGTYQTWRNPDTNATTQGDVGDMGYADRMQQQWEYSKSAAAKAAATQRILGSIGSLSGGSGGESFSGSAGGGTGGAVGPTQVSLPSSQASDAAAMTRSKEQSGQALAGAAKTLRQTFNARGMGGAGQEGVQLRQLISDSARSQTATGADLLRQSLDRTSAVNTENANLQEGYANRQTNYNVSQQQIALQAKIAAQTQLTDLLRTVGALV
jgi:hypothetical protein